MRTGQWTGCTRRPAQFGFPQQLLLQDVYLTTIENLALELERWVRAAEQLEATRPLIEATRACTAGRDTLSGELETRDLTVDIRRDTEPHQEIGIDRDQGAAGPGGSISLRATSTRTSAIWELALPPGAMATV
ncbi:hypothetical protein OHB31_00405 [Streptomyces microflavus]|uniref:hypothetical protein n=1 Tax=Streptomyces microflavus TaxID=1919 RepID=UPI002DDA7F92|nr:hypothetical protein [Streptomyces microflavus]WSA58708.1 hypothetical protein OHB31_00405 [Streptomyces microflavus]